MIIPCPRTCPRILSRETSSAVSSRVSLLISILKLNRVPTYGILPSSAAASIYETAIRHRVSPEFIGSRNCVPMAFTAEICASLSHTHCWYEVGMLEVLVCDFVVVGGIQYYYVFYY